MGSKALLVGLLLIGSGLAGGYVVSPQAQQEKEVSICDFVNHFGINRPAEIDENELPFLKLLYGLSSKESGTFNKLEERIRNGPITNVNQLDEVLKEAGWDQGKNSAMGKMLRIFFSLGERCVKSTQEVLVCSDGALTRLPSTPCISPE